MMKAKHKYKLIILGIVISVFSVILFFWFNYKNQMDNLYEAWINSKKEIYYQHYVISKLKMYISLIVPLVLMLPIELSIFISYLNKKNNHNLDKIYYLFIELVLGILLTIIVAVLYMARNAETLMFVYYGIAPIFAVLSIFTTNYIIKDNE